MAKNGVIKFKQLNKAVMDILSEYESYVSEGVCDRAFTAVSEEAVQQLQATSPRSKHGGDYAKSWTFQKQYKKRGKTSFIIYADAPHYRLTHLLEKGHAKVNGGRVAAIPHIAPVDDALGDKVVQRIKEELS